MIPLIQYVDTLALAERCKATPGCVVECGVWKGGMAAGLVSVLGVERDYFLFDSFEGLPPAKEIDGPAAIQWQRQTDAPNYFDNCAAREKICRSRDEISRCHAIPIGASRAEVLSAGSHGRPMQTFG